MAAKLTQDAINDRLSKAGLPEATMLETPMVSKGDLGGTGSSVIDGISNSADKSAIDDSSSGSKGGGNSADVGLIAGLIVGAVCLCAGGYWYTYSRKRNDPGQNPPPTVPLQMPNGHLPFPISPPPIEAEATVSSSYTREDSGTFSNKI